MTTKPDDLAEYFTTSEYAAENCLPLSTAKSHLLKLVSSGKLEKIKRRRISDNTLKFDGVHRAYNQGPRPMVCFYRWVSEK